MAKKTTTNPIVTGEEQNGKILHITFVDGNKYKLVHPGNRTKLSWEKETMNVATGIDRELYLDYAFQNCVISVGHEFQPSIDNVTPHELEVWEKLLRRFLNGDIQHDVAASDDAGAKTRGKVQDRQE